MGFNCHLLILPIHLFHIEVAEYSVLLSLFLACVVVAVVQSHSFLPVSVIRSIRFCPPARFQDLRVCTGWSLIHTGIWRTATTWFPRWGQGTSAVATGGASERGQADGPMYLTVTDAVKFKTISILQSTIFALDIEIYSSSDTPLYSVACLQAKAALRFFLLSFTTSTKNSIK